MSDLEQLVRASRLYYELGETQNAIAERLGVTRPQVSRLLKRARAEGIVEIRIVDSTTAESPAGEALRAQLRARCRPPGPDDRRPRGPDPPDGRPARRRRCCAPSSATGAIVGIGDGASVSATADALEEAATPVAVTVVPLCGGYWSTGPEREPYRRVAEALGGPAARADGARARRRRRHETGARRARRRPGRPRPVGPPRRRAVRDRRPGLERGGRRSATVERELEQRRRRRRGPRRAVRPRRPVRLPGAARAGHRVRCATARPGPGPPSASPSGEGKVRPILGALRAGVVRTLVTDVATAEAVVALDEATLSPAHGRASERHEGARREPAVLGHRPRARPRSRPGSSRSTGGCSALARAGLRRSTSAADHGWAEQDPGRLVVRGRQRRSGPCTGIDSAEVVAIGVDGHGPTLVAVDARGEATRAGDHLPRHAVDRRGRRAGRRDRGPRLGARRAAGRALGRAPRAGGRGGHPLVPRDLGVARVPPDRRRGRRRSCPTSSSPIAPRRDDAGVPAATAARRSADRRAVVGALTATAADALGLRAGIPVVGGTVDAFASYLGAGLLRARRRLRPGRRRPAASASTGIARSTCRAAS